MCECVTLNSPSKAEWGETLLYFSPFWTCPVASLHTRHLFLEVGVLSLSAPASSSRVSDC